MKRDKFGNRNISKLLYFGKWFRLWIFTTVPDCGDINWYLRLGQFEAKGNFWVDK